KRREEIQESAGLSGRTLPINAADVNTETEPAGKPVDESNPGADEIQPGDLRFSLQFFLINDQLAVINEIPYLDDGSSGSSVQSLLLAILKALEIEPAHLNDPQLFSWPLAVEDDASAHRQADALLALEGFMSKRLESSRLSHLLVFAGKFRDILQDDIAVNGAFRNARAQVIVTHSIHAMLRIPALKKQVWEELRVLKGRLPSGGQ
ncbi:MAG: hypothetical protein JKY98_10750, partial [Gammaproteobacteria bacterium]|nr:hypothetical protein [Gammaproteobacteria bacterium]